MNPERYDILRRCGYPTNVLVVDFESYYDDEYTLSKMSTWEYVTDARFEEIGHAIVEVTQPHAEPTPKFWFADEVNYIRAMRDTEPDLRSYTVVAQNLAFDGLILWLKYGIRPRYCIDL